MSKPLDAYLERSRRVTSILVLIQAGIDEHDRKAAKPENAGKLEAMNRKLQVLEAELKPALWFISGLTEVEIDEALNDGGKHNE